MGQTALAATDDEARLRPTNLSPLPKSAGPSGTSDVDGIDSATTNDDGNLANDFFIFTMESAGPSGTLTSPYGTVTFVKANMEGLLNGSNVSNFLNYSVIQSAD